MNQFRKLLVLALMKVTFISAQVSGTVFRDYNFTGLRDSSANYVDPWIVGATVKLIGKTGLIGIALTDDKGRYSFNPAVPPPYRVELVNNNPFDFESVLNTQNLGSRSSIRFVKFANQQVNFGINYPSEFFKDPKLITPCYVSGDPLPPSSYYANLETLISWDIDNGGVTNQDAKTQNHNGNAPNVNVLATAKEIGSCWAIAVQKKDQKLYTLATLKRHSALGPLGIGGLYQLDLTNNSLTNQFDLNSIGVISGIVPSNISRGLKSTYPPVSQDSIAFSMAAKVGYGGMDITEDEKKLFIVSLYTRKLYSVFINSPYVTPTPANVDSFSIPDPGCVGGTFRPWAVKVYRGKVYVGVVCDGSSSGLSSDLSATVYEFDPATKIFTKVSQFSLDYPGFSGASRYKAWIDTWDTNCLQGDHIYCSYSQAILSDIDFDGDDVMVFTFADRYGLQAAYAQPNTSGTGKYSMVSFGDILRGRRVLPSSQFIIENNANDGIRETAGKNTGIGPGFGEYYFGDHSLFKDAVLNENESLIGSSQIYPGQNGVISTSQDPFDLISGGVIHLNNISGNWTKRYEIIPADEALFIGKSAGLGDLKMSTEKAPIQIGNYAWMDNNGNGIQDPIEQALRNVEIVLYKDGNEIARAITNQFGEYLFSNESNPGLNLFPSSFIYGITELQADMDYQLRILSAQVALTNFHTTQYQVGFPNNNLIDNNAQVLNPAEIGASIHTGIDGETNYSIDFGFIPNSSCNIILNSVKVNPCDALTNSFSVNFDYNVTNAVIGNVVIELSTGETAKHYIIEDGTYNFVFTNIESKGISNINIKIYLENDPTCILNITNAFNQPDPCCNNQYKLCSNRANVVNLDAIPGMAQYRWYKSSDNAVVGFTETLVISNSSPGLEDNTESYYFVAIDSTGDTIKQFCAYQVDLINCCRLNVSTFIQTDCDNNGTAYFAGDDWFSVFIAADNADAGPSSRFEVVVNDVVLGNAAYGASILVGSGINREFKADGVSVYKVIIRDIDNHACLDSIFTEPRICPLPSLTLTKSVVSYSIASDASYNITYRIEVENQGTETGLYSLRDVPGFDDDIIVKTAFYTSNVPFKSGAALIGSGPWNLINNQLIAPGIKHTFNIVINFVIDLKNGTPGDNVYSPCSSMPKAGESLFNRVLLDSDGDNVFDQADTACANIPVYFIQKDLIGNTQVDLYNSKLLYRIVVKNQGSLAGSYSLIENPSFDDDVRITSARYRILNSAFTNIVLPKPASGWVLTTNRPIAISACDTFYVEFDIHLDLRAGSIGDNIYNSCSKGLVPGNSTFNIVGIDLNGDLRTELRDTTCNDLPSLSHEKSLWSKKLVGVDMNEVVYLFVVRNQGAGQGIYSLKDRLAYDDDLSINSTQITVNNSIPISLSGLFFNSTFDVVQNKVINGYSTDSIFVKFDLRLDLSPGNLGNREYISCTKDLTGNYLPNHGLFNESLMYLNADTVPSEKDTVCTDFEYYDLAIRKLSLNINTLKIGSNIFFRNIVFNQGTAMARNIVISDYITQAYDFNSTLSPGWSLLNDSIAIYIIDSLPAKDSIILDNILILRPFKDVTQTINTSEISSFLSKDRTLVEDIDSSPDQIKRNDNLVTPDSPEDNLISGRKKLNNVEDEDDQDIAQIPTFDIALRKRIDVNPPYHYNQIIPFKITLYNQGYATIYSATIVDYLPSGYTFDPVLNPDWVLNGTQATLLVVDSLKSGDTLDRFINLKLLAVDNPVKWINSAEILNASISRRVGVHFVNSDLDSDFDNQPTNDMGGKVNTLSDDHILDDGNDLDMDGIKDEDDHDPAVPFIWDLALKKLLVTTSPHYPGSKLNFVIRIFNQGTDTVGSVSLMDYIPAGLKFFVLDNPDWTLTGSLATATFQRTVVPGDSADFNIILTLLPGSRQVSEWINYAEIIGSTNNKGLSRTGFDIDSKENSNNSVERNLLPFTPGDNDIFTDGISGDEDDHDPAMPRILDLALMKKLNNFTKVYYGETIEFTIEIVNQGLIPIDQISLVDYIPLGLEWLPNVNWNYLPGNRYAIYTLNQRIDPGSTFTLPIKLKVISVNGQVSDLVNVAEIVSANDTLGILYNRDIDSQFDFDKFNDVGGVPNSLTDNFINDDGLDSDGDGVMDEDDADPAVVNLVDFALKKEMVNIDKGAIGDTLNFKITVYNQGNVTASSISIIDYLTNAYQFLPSLNPAWTVAGSNLMSTKNTVVAPGSSTEFNLLLKVLSSNDPDLFCNYAEINHVIDANSTDITLLDADSDPNSNSIKERLVKPGSTDDNRIDGNGKSSDEDDHDVAGPVTRARLGDMVWEDRNANGIMEQGERGIADVQVQLFDFNTQLLLKNTFTNGNGKYLFDNLVPGKYFIKFIPPPGCTISPADKTIDSLDSDVSGAFGLGTTGMIMLAGGSDDRTWDAGLYKCMFVDGYVWYDFNKNGVQSATENGINGMEVRLYSYPEKKLQAKVNTAHNKQFISRDGYYSFCVKPGTYYIQLQTLSGFVISPFQVGANKVMDSDLDNSNGNFTSNLLSGFSKDSLRNINGGIYNPSFLLVKEKSNYEIPLETRSQTELILTGQTQINTNVLKFYGVKNECLRFYNVYRKTSQENQFEKIFTGMINKSEDLNCKYEYKDSEVIGFEQYVYFIEALDEQYNTLASDYVYVNRNLADDLLIQPNPAKDLTTLYYTGSLTDGAGLEIRSIQGTQFYLQNNIQQANIEISTKQWPEGVYLVNWITGDVKIQKLLIVTH